MKFMSFLFLRYHLQESFPVLQGSGDVFALEKPEQRFKPYDYRAVKVYTDINTDRKVPRDLEKRAPALICSVVHLQGGVICHTNGNTTAIT